MWIEVPPGPTITLGVVPYVTVHNPGSETTTYELFGRLVAKHEIGPGQSQTSNPGAGVAVSIKNLGPDLLLAEIPQVIQSVPHRAD